MVLCLFIGSPLTPAEQQAGLNRSRVGRQNQVFEQAQRTGGGQTGDVWPVGFTCSLMSSPHPSAPEQLWRCVKAPLNFNRSCLFSHLPDPHCPNRWKVAATTRSLSHPPLLLSGSGRHLQRNSSYLHLRTASQNSAWVDRGATWAVWHGDTQGN